MNVFETLSAGCRPFERNEISFSDLSDDELAVILQRLFTHENRTLDFHTLSTWPSSAVAKLSATCTWNYDSVKRIMQLEFRKLDLAQSAVQPSLERRGRGVTGTRKVRQDEHMHFAPLFDLIGPHLRIVRLPCFEDREFALRLIERLIAKCPNIRALHVQDARPSRSQMRYPYYTTVCNAPLLGAASSSSDGPGTCPAFWDIKYNADGSGCRAVMYIANSGRRLLPTDRFGVQETPWLRSAIERSAVDEQLLVAAPARSEMIERLGTLPHLKTLTVRHPSTTVMRSLQCHLPGLENLHLFNAKEEVHTVSSLLTLRALYFRRRAPEFTNLKVISFALLSLSRSRIPCFRLFTEKAYRDKYIPGLREVLLSTKRKLRYVDCEGKRTILHYFKQICASLGRLKILVWNQTQKTDHGDAQYVLFNDN